MYHPQQCARKSSRLCILTVSCVRASSRTQRGTWRPSAGTSRCFRSCSTPTLIWERQIKHELLQPTGQSHSAVTSPTPLCLTLEVVRRAAMDGHAPALQVLVQAPGVNLEATSNVSLLRTPRTKLSVCACMCGRSGGWVFLCLCVEGRICTLSHARTQTRMRTHISQTRPRCTSPQITDMQVHWTC